MGKTKKLLFLIATLYQGGGERVVSELSLNFPSEIETTILLYENKVSYPFKGKLLNLDVPISLNFFLRGFSFLVRFLKFKKVLVKEKPDYVVSFGNSGNMMNIFANKDAIVRVDMHPTRGNKGFWGFLYRVFIRLFFNRAKKIISVSKVAANDLVQNYGVLSSKIQIIHNPIDIDKIQRLAQESLLNEYEEAFSHPVVVTMGRLCEQKGQWHLIHAFKEVKALVPDAKLFILGDGELRDSLRILAKKLGLEHDVYLPGFQKNPFAFVARSRVFVLSSLWEGLPGVILEAMACGVPVVSSDCKSGPREILAPSTDIRQVAISLEYVEYGALVPVGEEHAFAEAIKEILTNKGLAAQMAEKAKLHAEDFRITKILREWKFLFQ